MKTRRIVALLLALTMVLGLAACGSKTDPTPTETKPSEVKETVKPSEGEEPAAEELTVWCWDPAFNIYAMKEAEKLYQKDHPNFKLNIVETPWPDVQTKVIAAATSGNIADLPDILLMQDNAFQKNAISFPGLFLDLEQSGIKFDDFTQGKTAYSVIDGKHYGVPFDNGAAIAAYRTDILEEAGFTVADFTDITWDE